MKIIPEVKVSDNGFVFNSKTGESFSVNLTGLELIKMMSDEIDPEKIKEVFLSKYDTDDLSFEKDFLEFCTLLRHYQITIYDNPLEFN